MQNKILERIEEGYFTVIEAAKVMSPLLPVFPADTEGYLQENCKPTRSYRGSKSKYYSFADAVEICNKLKTIFAKKGA